MFLENFPAQNQQYGWIEVICGCMFSGKTEELIRRIRRAELAHQSIKSFKPSIDQRYSDTEVVSHIGTSLEAIPVQTAQEIIQLWKNERIIAIDEAQFFDDSIVQVVNELAAKGVRVIIAGLDMDFQGKPFGPMPALIAVAEYVTKVHAICVKCAELAHYSHRKTEEKSTVLVGETEHYEALCRTCFNAVQK